MCVQKTSVHNVIIAVYSKSPLANLMLFNDDIVVADWENLLVEAKLLFLPFYIIHPNWSWSL